MAAPISSKDGYTKANHYQLTDIIIHSQTLLKNSPISLRNQIIRCDPIVGPTADSPANQRRFPQSASQAKGCGFPLIKFVVLFSLTSGAILEVVLGNKHVHEVRLFRRLWHRIKAGAILLAMGIMLAAGTLLPSQKEREKRCNESCAPRQGVLQTVVPQSMAPNKQIPSSVSYTHLTLPTNREV